MTGERKTENRRQETGDRSQKGEGRRRLCRIPCGRPLAYRRAAKNERLCLNDRSAEPLFLGHGGSRPLAYRRAAKNERLCLNDRSAEPLFLGHGGGRPKAYRKESGGADSLPIRTTSSASTAAATHLTPCLLKLLPLVRGHHFL